MSKTDKNVKDLKKLLNGAKALRKDGKHREALDLLEPQEEQWGGRSYGFAREMAFCLYHLGSGEGATANNQKASVYFKQILNSEGLEDGQRLEAAYCAVNLAKRMEKPEKAAEIGEKALTINKAYKAKQTEEHTKEVAAKQAAEAEKAAKKKDKKKNSKGDDEGANAVEEKASDEQLFVPKDLPWALMVKGFSLEVQAEFDEENAKQLLDDALEYLEDARDLNPDDKLVSGIYDRVMKKSLNFFDFDLDDQPPLGENAEENDPGASDTSMPALGEDGQPIQTTVTPTADMAEAAAEPQTDDGKIFPDKPEETAEGDDPETAIALVDPSDVKQQITHSTPPGGDDEKEELIDVEGEPEGEAQEFTGNGEPGQQPT